MNFITVIAEASTHLKHNGQHPPTLILSFAGVATPIRRTITHFSEVADERGKRLYLEGQLIGQSFGHLSLQQAWFVVESLVQYRNPPPSFTKSPAKRNTSCDRTRSDH